MKPPPKPSEALIRIPLRPVRLTYGLMGFFVVSFMAGVFLRSAGVDVLALAIKDNAAIARGEYWRLASAMFIHQGLLHLAVNMASLYSLGRAIEPFFGFARTGVIFLLAGIASSVTSFLLTPSPALGAAGAIFGWVGAYLIFVYRNRQVFTERGHRDWQNLIIMVCLNFIAGSLIRWDTAGLLGGLLCGLGLGWWMGPLWVFQPAPVPPQIAALPSAPQLMLTAIDRQPFTYHRWVEALAILLVLLSVTVGVANWR